MPTMAPSSGKQKRQIEHIKVALLRLWSIRGDQSYSQNCQNVQISGPRGP